jgi:hypothetical protein
MANLFEILDDAHDGEAVTLLGREFELTPKQTEAAVTAMLPAISAGLKQSTATVDGLGNLFAVMGQQKDLHALYDDAETALGPEGLAAGNDVLSVIFGSPDVSEAVVDQAQKFSGVDSNILKKLLPVLAGILVSGLTRSGSASASPGVPTSSPGAPTPSGGGGGGLGDILGQIFGRAMSGSPGTSAGPGAQIPSPSGPPPSAPTDTGEQPVPGGDLLGYILREMEKGIREGRIKPVVIGPMQIPIPGGQAGPMPSGPGAPQVPGGDILGQILRDVLGGLVGGQAQTSPGQQGPSPPMKDLSDRSKQLGVMGGVGAAVFGDHFEAGRDVDQSHVNNIQSVFDRLFGAQQR